MSKILSQSDDLVACESIIDICSSSAEAALVLDLRRGRDSAAEGRRIIGMNNTFDEVDFDYATTIADRANRSMSQHAVPPTPNNFSVWFSYAMGASPALRKTIDILVGNKRKFDSSINRDLYVRYVDPQPDAGAADDFPEQLRGVISSATQFLTTAISDNARRSPHSARPPLNVRRPAIRGRSSKSS
jgi:hypothetical protein